MIQIKRIINSLDNIFFFNLTQQYPIYVVSKDSIKNISFFLKKNINKQLKFKSTDLKVRCFKSVIDVFSYIINSNVIFVSIFFLYFTKKSDFYKYMLYYKLPILYLFESKTFLSFCFFYLKNSN